MIPCRIGVCEVVMGKDVNQVDTTHHKYVDTKHFVIVTTVLNILTIFAGCVIKNLGMVFKINGSVVATMIALILPSLF